MKVIALGCFDQVENLNVSDPSTKQNLKEIQSIGVSRGYPVYGVSAKNDSYTQFNINNPKVIKSEGTVHDFVVTLCRNYIASPGFKKRDFSKVLD